MKTILRIILPFFLFTSSISLSQTSDDFQKKIDSLEIIKSSLTQNLNNLNIQINELKQLKGKAQANEQVGQIYVFRRDGEIYDNANSMKVIAKAKEGTRVIFVKEEGAFGMEVLFNGDKCYVYKNWVIPIAESLKQEREQQIKDSILILNAKTFVFSSEGELYKATDDIQPEIKVPIGTQVLFVKDVKGRFVDCLVIYEQNKYYTSKSYLMSSDIYKKKIEFEKEKEENYLKYKQSILTIYGTKDGQRIIDHKIWIGMTKEMLIESWGKPDDINRTVTLNNTSEQWVYGSQYVYLDNGIVTAWQD